ncbi:MAG: Ig-like domain-containing protein [Pirellulaceae bacterium]
MRKASWKRAKRERRGKAVRRRLRSEPLEPRIVLTATPTLIDLHPGASSDPDEFVQIGGAIFFVATDADHGRELWKTDGTVQGTELVRDITGDAASSNPAHLTNVNGVLFFSADDGMLGEELWKSDGTEQGTVRVRDIHTSQTDPTATSSSPSELVSFNGMLYFTAQGDDGRELWRSDGTEQGTVQVADLFPGTDGVDPNSSNPTGLTVVGSQLFFAATDDDGTELWKSNGTAGGTMMVKDLFPGDDGGGIANSSSPGQLTNVDGVLFFTAQDDNGLELWKSDGTTDGTVMVEDIFAGDDGGGVANSSSPSNLVNVGGTLFFVANDGVHGQELWKSGGTAETTELVKSILPGIDGQDANAASLTAVNGVLFLTADDGQNGLELWKSDGTEAGTVMVADILPGVDGGSSDPLSSAPAHLTNINGLLYFSAFTTDANRELWQSDGTAAGTLPVTDVDGASDGLFPTAVVSINGSLLVSTDNAGLAELFVLEGEAQQGGARLTIFVDGQEIEIPADVGVFNDGATTALHTTGDMGQLAIASMSGATLGAFFETWRTNAGLAGNNPDALFSATQLMTGTASATHTVQMFVNGQVSYDFENYVVQDGDDITLVYSSNPVVSLNTNFGSILVELFDGATPITVNNFLNYVNDGDYLNSIFHRSAKYANGEDFVIQAGGFTTNSTTFTNTSQFTSVPTDAQIQNEPGISNLRTTIAMAKVGNNPNSATSQFFFNLNDLNDFLDLPQNNSFTVFGRVLGMTTVDDIADLPVNTNNASPFGELPVSADNQLAVIQSITGQGDLTGVKYVDANSNGVQDAGEAGIAGAIVYADANDNNMLDDGERFTTTDAMGRYLLQVTPGQYTVISDVVGGQTAVLGGAGHQVTVEIGRVIDSLDFSETPPPAPTGLDLLAVSDTGAASDDDITSKNNRDAATVLQFQVTGVTDGAVVRVYSDGVEIGSAVASGGAATVTTDASTVLADGARAITARQFINGAQGAPSGTLTVTIDATAPAAVTGTPPETVVHGQLFEFDAQSADEGQTGVVYSLDGEPTGMTIDAQTGEITWTPTLAQTGPQPYTVLLTDTAGNVAMREFEVTVLADLPAFPDAYLIDQGSTLAVGAAAGVLANDNNGDPTGLTASVVGQPAHGTLTLNADGSFIYTPDAGFVGIDSFTYIASDGSEDSNVARATITVIAPNDAPQAVDDAYTVDGDSSLSVSAAQGVLVNDSDAEQDPVTAVLVAGPAHGVVTLNADGSFTYTPTFGFVGEDSFTYVAADALDSSAPATVRITVETPTLSPADFSASIAGSVYLDADGDGVRSAGEFGVPGALLTLTGTSTFGGAITRTRLSDANGFYRFEDLPAGVYQVAESQPQALVDGLESSSAAGATVGNDVISSLQLAEGQELVGNNFGERDIAPQYINAVWFFASTAANGGGMRNAIALGEEHAGNTQLAALIRAGATDLTQETNVPPSAADESYATAEDAAITIAAAVGVLANDIDANADPLSAQLVSTTANGALTFNPNGAFTYTPNAGFVGSDSFTYLTSDGLLGSNTATVRIDVGLSSNTAPVASDDAYAVSGPLVTAAAGGVSSNDTDAQGHSLMVRLIDGPQFGTLSLAPDGSFVYTPDQGYFGADSFTYQSSDGELDSNTATVNFTVTLPANHAPVAVNNAYVSTGISLTVSATNGVLANDIDDDENDTLTAQLVDGPQHGVLTLNADGSFTYTPENGFSGTDSFTYRANDGQVDSEIATVTISVTAAPNVPPTAVSDAYSTELGVPLTIAAPQGVLANDSDGNGDPLTAVQNASVQAGTLSFNADGSFTYTPGAGFSGTDTFSYRANDGQAFSSVAIVTIVVRPPNQAPIGVADSYDVDQDTTLTIDAAAGVLLNDTDDEDDPLTAILVSGPAHGVLTFQADGSFQYVPDPGYVGGDSFSYRANDGRDDSGVTTVTLDIAAAEGEAAEGEPFEGLADQVFSEDEDWL